MSQAAIVPMPGFKFGCDPEVFVVDSDGKPVSPDFIPGTKDEPFKVKYGAVQRDGMAAEFNIDPAETFHDFNRNINAVMNQLKSMIPKGHSLAIIPSTVFPLSEWEKAPDFAKELGCSPDFDAWTGGCNPPPTPPQETLRCAGGHIHIGWTDNAQMDDAQHILNCRDLVKQLDWFVGSWSIKQDPDPVRRNLYGKAGACRYKPYGVEYRVLSNFWIKNTQSRLALWNRVNSAINEMSGLFIPEKGSFMNDYLIHSINTSKLHNKLYGIRYPIQTTDTLYNNYF